MTETKRYWYNTRTGEVEDGPQSLATDRIGPFATADEARNALEIVKRRSEEWAAEDAAEDQE